MHERSQCILKSVGISVWSMAKQRLNGEEIARSHTPMPHVLRLRRPTRTFEETRSAVLTVRYVVSE